MKSFLYISRGKDLLNFVFRAPLLFGALLIFIASCGVLFFSFNEASAIATEENLNIEIGNYPNIQPSVDSKVSPILITSYSFSGGKLDFIQIHNTSNSIVSLDGWKAGYLAIYEDSSESDVEINLSGYLPGKSFAVFSGHDISGVDGRFELDGSGVVKIDSLYIKGLESETYEIKSGAYDNGVRYDMQPTSAGNYTSSRSFTTTDMNKDLIGGGLYRLPENPVFEIVEILANPKDCTIEQIDDSCYDYIKVYNPTDEDISLDGYSLRIGFINESIGINNNIPISGQILAKQFGIIKFRSDGKNLDIPMSKGSVWVEDSYNLIHFKESLVEYSDLGGISNKGKSWARLGGVWGYGLPNPSGENIQWVDQFDDEVQNYPDCKEGWYRNENTGRCRLIPAESSTLVPCKPGQERNPETNRCRNIVTGESTLTPCKPGQERNSETNRCRNITSSTVSNLVPCKPGQERNPETNRCRNINSSSNSLTPCKPGQERNPETNRCRNIKATKAPEADFAVSDIEGEIKSTFQAWHGFLVLAGLGVVYGLLEWRVSILNFIRNLFGK